MEHAYESIIELLSCVMEPMPLNQLGVPDYCRNILATLARVKQMIEDLEKYYRGLMRSYNMSMDVEF